MNETERWKERPFLRPLAVFRGNALYGCSQDRQTVFRRDFDLDDGEKFDAEWFAGWNTYKRARKGGDLWRPQRLARARSGRQCPSSSPRESSPSPPWSWRATCCAWRVPRQAGLAGAVACAG